MIALVLAAALGVFAVIAAMLARGLPEDLTILTWLHSQSSSPIDSALRWATYAGGMFVIVPIGVGVFAALRRRRRADAWFLVAAVAGSEILNLALKLAFHRERPSEAWSAAAAGYAFPSGHAMSSLVFYGALAALAWHSRWRWTVCAGSALLVVVVGTSRLALGVHYPSDVIAGWCAGAAWLSALTLSRAPHRGDVRALARGGAAALRVGVTRQRRRLARTRPENTIAVLAGLVGLLGIVSALTPGIASRVETLQTLLPTIASTAARFVVLAVGIALVWLARALAERRRRAWQLAVMLAATSVGAHVIRGLDVEEATVGALLVVLLVRYRPRFTVPGPRDITAPFVGSVAGLVAAAAFLEWSEHLETPPPGVVTRLAQMIAILLAARAFALWLRPLGERVLQGAEERRAAHRIVESDGHDSLSYFALRQDKHYHFSESGRSFLAYRTVGSVALVSGDPIGDPGEVLDLLADFQRMARARGWRVAVLGAGVQHLPEYRQLGLRSIRLGEEAIICPNDFSLEGRPIRKVRQSVTRLRREGFAIRFARASELTGDERAQVEAISREWLGRWPERGFTMAMDDLFSHSQTHLALATDQDGRIGGFLHLVPSPASGAISLSAMRRRHDVPNGLMEFLIVETINWARERGAPEVSLNFCVLTHALGRQKGVLRTALRFGLRRLDGVFQLERLLRFNRKFFPQWRARYVLVERLSDVPIVGIAFLRVEQLLTIPSARAAMRRKTSARTI